MSRATGRAPTRIIEVAQDGKQIWAGLLSPAARLTTNCCTRLFAKEWDQRESGHTVQPPPTEQPGRRQADHQNDRQITARDPFDRVSQKTFRCPADDQ